ncbi:NADH-ubiquinone oxidoreductase-F iron-sulfur binding region domain-containing protein [Paraglaciecola aquimarina]|uniref:NADH-quinone oxidoreductase subunit F n=1 Tax=Paraglaciecola aquimarina TaxID=1235557 RepID=A0ABU3ST18_9ALTE|nr:NADH-ubiquinone oxidoreductase-F iron-sulfur binding region domain-containing protein [Paraglaciecola aquimarina]MDU0353159.1 NADH-ubiquinone oxidoreductase-F iron-sulfur binding region domain-containing protein [Paraglaciecola aquimarina]
MSMTVFIPRDTSALAQGAHRIAALVRAEAQQRNLDIKIVRNGSRGMFWLEPLLEVSTEHGRVAYGPVSESDISSLFDAEFHLGKPEHPLYLGQTDNIPYLAKQQRLTFARAGIIDPVSIDDYLRHDGFKGLRKALTLSSQATIDEVTCSGLRGRGGAAFPTGIKWQTVHDCNASQKYIVCNADEGDSGSFADRLVMEADPLMLIEGMIIAGLAVGANQGYIYLRSEYPVAHQILNEAIENAYSQGYLGGDILASGQTFNLEVRLGAGAYICGEETSLLESLEGKRGLVRFKPPLPAIEGLFGCPTVINNVLSLAAIPYILAEGGNHYANYGMGRSKGTLPLQLAGNVNQGGLIELAFGLTLRELLNEFAGGTFTGKPMHAIQVGGPLGAYLPESQWDTPLDYESFTAIQAVLGHGSIVVFDDTVDMLQQARFSMEFCVAESCGKCTPCRIGSVRGLEVIDKIQAGINPQQNIELLDDLCETMIHGSLCAMGGMTPFPVQSAFKHFADSVDASIAKHAGEQ